MPQTAAIVTTLKNPGPSLDSFIRYHLEIGFSNLFLFFDDPSDPSIARAQKYPNVVVIKNDARLRRSWQKTHIAITNPYLYEFRKSEVSLRQELNVEIAIQLALEKNVDWLLHIDSDELFYPFQEQVPAHFQSLSDRRIENVIYANYEGIPETLDIEDYFREVTLFKRNFYLFPELILSRQQTRVTKGVSQLSDRLFLFYADGKSAARLNNRLLPDGVHRFKAKQPQRSRDSSKPISPSICRSAAILHYPCCGFSNFWRKYKTLGSFGDKWFNLIDIAESIGSFHQESRDIVLRNHKEKAREFYKRRVVIDKKSVIKLLIDNGVACRIKDPFTRLNRPG